MDAFLRHCEAWKKAGLFFKCHMATHIIKIILFPVNTLLQLQKIGGKKPCIYHHNICNVETGEKETKSLSTHTTKTLDALEHQINPICAARVYWTYRVDYLHTLNCSDYTADPAPNRRLDCKPPEVPSSLNHYRILNSFRQVTQGKEKNDFMFSCKRGGFLK